MVYFDLLKGIYVEIKLINGFTRFLSGLIVLIKDYYWHLSIGDHTERIAFLIIHKVAVITTAMKQNTTSMPSRNVLIKCIYYNTLSSSTSPTATP